MEVLLYYGHKLHATAGIPLSWRCRCHRMVPLVEYRVWLQGSSKSNEELQQKPGKGGLKAICSASWS
uniref:Uncharacterized protein n=1 Tax=Oryza meridionalis TaxID=40149 RepID=A0A0E0DDH2_9ORYZ